MSVFSDAQDQERLYQKTRRQRGLQRSHVLYLQDQITLASFHKRPDYEIKNLLDRLRVAVERKDN